MLLLQYNGELTIRLSENASKDIETPYNFTSSSAIVQGDSLTSCQSLISENSKYTLVVQDNGYLTFNLSTLMGDNSSCNYSENLWSSFASTNTTNNYSSASSISDPVLLMQTDGNLALYATSNNASIVLWASNTSGTNCDTMRVMNDGRFIVYESTTGNIYFDSSNTSYNAANSSSSAPVGSIYTSGCVPTTRGLFTTGTTTSSIENLVLTMSSNGNAALIVNYNKDESPPNYGGSILWSTKTENTPSDTLQILDTGKMIVYEKSTGNVYYDSSNVYYSANNSSTATPVYNLNSILNTSNACKSFPTKSVDYITNTSNYTDGSYTTPSVTTILGRPPIQLLFESITFSNDSVFIFPNDYPGYGYCTLVLPKYGVINNGTKFYLINDNTESDFIIRCPTYGNYQNFVGLVNDESYIIPPQNTSIVMMIEQTWNVISIAKKQGIINDSEIILPLTPSPSPSPV